MGANLQAKEKLEDEKESKFAKYVLTPEDETETKLGRECLALKRMKNNTTSDIEGIKKTNRGGGWTPGSGKKIENKSSSFSVFET